MNKYHAGRAKADGMIFDSRKEAARYCELKLLEKAGEISCLRRQVKYTVIPAQRDADGKIIERECTYIADFVYILNGETIVEDVKGYRTKDYIIKRKLMLYHCGIRVREV